MLKEALLETERRLANLEAKITSPKETAISTNTTVNRASNEVPQKKSETSNPLSFSAKSYIGYKHGFKTKSPQCL